MASVLRLFIGIGLTALGYYVGREVGRLESLREDMERLRESTEQKNTSEKPVPDPS